MRAYARYLDLFGPSRLKEMIFTRGCFGRRSARRRLRPRDRRGRRDRARVRALAETVASHAPITLWVTKEAIRRIQEARAVADGDDLIAATYGSADFHEGVSAFVEKRPPRWTGGLRAPT